MAEKELKGSGAVEIVQSDDDTKQRLETIACLARTCEELAAALGSPTLVVNFHGPVTAKSEHGVLMMGKRGSRRNV